MINWEWRTVHIKGYGATACKNLQGALRETSSEGWTVIKIMPHAESFCVVARRQRAERSRERLQVQLANSAESAVGL